MAKQEIQADLLLSMYVDMLRIRGTEERLGDMVSTGEVKCPTHLYIGEEAVAVGVCKALRKDDYIFGNHRSHGHYLARGGDLKQLMAEVLGKKTGCSGGRGGSMHLTAPEIGLMGTSAMVASGVPLAVGAALAFAMKRTKRVAVTFFGDGATEEGEFYESLNLAALRKTPVIFVCENNLYSSHVHIKYRRPADNIADLARAHCMPALRIDGNDVIAVYKTTRKAVEDARVGKGPTFIECRTYRWRGHVGPNYDLEKGLRNKEELDQWMARCPIRTLENHLIRDDLMTEPQAKTIRGQIVEEVEAAIQWARRSPLPDELELADNVFG
jgi:TPP-dependent pyruvate/acetoin dehydrogenase alpha subunit